MDVQRGQLNFTKGCIIAESVLSLSRTLTKLNLTMIVSSFGGFVA
ncbi:DUF645 family protein [Vibrio cholerae]|nr:DUF645 family protein [Vibrio cholerae]MCR9379263.1 DUF645 family protein [Vibrio cholerae]MDT8797073.1 DUF645 family protein [Vibrio cholerae]MDT8830409.1 DUF645 family protein [Vibrio cholerae]WOQ95329.1 DUF645 family protein [Vibrio cholerae]